MNTLVALVVFVRISFGEGEGDGDDLLLGVITWVLGIFFVLFSFGFCLESLPDEVVVW